MRTEADKIGADAIGLIKRLIERVDELEKQCAGWSARYEELLTIKLKYDASIRSGELLRVGRLPCGECHVGAGETCNICGARNEVSSLQRQGSSTGAAQG